MVAVRKFRNTMTTLAVAGLVAAAPAVAHADVVDTYLAAIPAGQISCQQANNYWTDAGDYQSKRSQALLAANFHPRGGEIRDALAYFRVVAQGADDLAFERIVNVPNGQAPAPVQQGGQQVQAPAPGQAPAQAQDNTVSIGGQTFPVPEILAPVVNWLRDALGNLGIRF